MTKRKKLLLIGFLLIVLTGCTNYFDRDTGQVMEEFIIRWGDPWNFGDEGIFRVFIVWPLAQLLNFFGQMFDASIGIVLVTILTRLLLLRNSIRAAVSQQKMQVIAPEQTKIQEKYKGRNDQQSRLQMNTEMQNLYKKNDINMFSTFLSAFIQLPIMIAMYQAVVRSYEVISGTVLGQPLSVSPREGFQTLNFIYIGIYVLMVLFQALSMFLPQYFAKKRQKVRKYDKQPSNNMNSMMYMSIVMISIFALNMSIGMSLYWMISALIQLIQVVYIQKKVLG